MGAKCALMELCELYWGVGQMGRDIPAQHACATGMVSAELES
jgi:hypothetical protein